MTRISFFAEGTPKGQPRPRAFARKMPNGAVIARVYEAGTAEAFKSAIALAAREHTPFKPLDGPIALELHFVFPRPKMHFRAGGRLHEKAPYWHTGKPDRDNLEKAVMDALTTLGMWRDDGQVCSGPVAKRYANEGEKPGVHVQIDLLAHAESVPVEQGRLAIG